MEAPSGRRDLAGYMFLGVFVERHVSTKVVVSFPDSLYIYRFFFGGCFSKRQKITDHLFISTLPETNSLHLKMDKLEYFLLSFWAFGVWPIFRCQTCCWFQGPGLSCHPCHQWTKAASSMACRSLGVGDLTRSTWLEWLRAEGREISNC